MRSHCFYVGGIEAGRQKHSVNSHVLLLLLGITTGSVQGNDATLTTTEIRTLKNAVTVMQYQPLIKNLLNQCSADILSGLPTVIIDADQLLPDNLLSQKLNISTSELKELLDKNEKFVNLTKAATINTPDCNDREAILDLTEQFSNNYTALELSAPLAPWQQHFATQPKTLPMDPEHLSELISNSHSIVLVYTQPKSLLTPLQQANFLHIDDKSNYVFEVQQGWKAITARYQGLHINISPDNYPQQPKRWLLLLDARFHPKTALFGAELQQALNLLGTPAWTFNRQGDLLRAKSISKP